MKFSFARGDSYVHGFVLKNGSTGEPFIEQWDDIYFTVKRQHSERNYKFQKRLSENGIVDDGDGHFTIHIDPADTDGLAFGTYDVDIEIKKGDYKHTFFGQLELTPEVTHVYNE